MPCRATLTRRSHLERAQWAYFLVTPHARAFVGGPRLVAVEGGDEGGACGGQKRLAVKLGVKLGSLVFVVGVGIAVHELWCTRFANDSPIGRWFVPAPGKLSERSGLLASHRMDQMR